MPFSTIAMQQRSAIPNDLAALQGRRLLTASETNDGTRLNEARIKALTGGDPITARFLHGEFFTFRPTAKFWLSLNHKPVVRDDSQLIGAARGRTKPENAQRRAGSSRIPTRRGDSHAARLRGCASGRANHGFQSSAKIAVVTPCRAPCLAHTDEWRPLPAAIVESRCVT